MYRDSTNLPAKYRPRAFAEIFGQPAAVDALRSFVEHARETEGSGAFLFHGPSGVGKTSAAWALALELGCDGNDPHFGGVTEIASGLQDGAAVDALVRSLRLRPLLGSGWKVAIVNEADSMTKQAEAIWLDALERLPSKSVVVFTTNDISGLGSRFVSRCEAIEFTGEPALVGVDFARFVRKVWKAETGRALGRLPKGLGVFDIAGGQLSFRLALQQLAPYARSGEPLPASFITPIVRDSDRSDHAKWRAAGLKAAATKRANAAQKRAG